MVATCSHAFSSPDSWGCPSIIWSTHLSRSQYGRRKKCLAVSFSLDCCAGSQISKSKKDRVGHNQRVWGGVFINQAWQQQVYPHQEPPCRKVRDFKAATGTQQVRDFSSQHPISGPHFWLMCNINHPINFNLTSDHTLSQSASKHAYRNRMAVNYAGSLVKEPRWSHICALVWSYITRPHPVTPLATNYLFFCK